MIGVVGAIDTVLYSVFIRFRVEVKIMSCSKVLC